MQRGLLGFSLLVLAAGTTVLALTFQHDGLALSLWALGSAAVWAAGGAVLLRCSEVPDCRGSRRWKSVLVAAVVLLCAGSFCGALVAEQVPVLSGFVADAVQTRTGAPWVVLGSALVAGMAEELFFRVGLRRLLPARWFVAASTAAYVLCTLATGNAALVLMAAILGMACALVLEYTGRPWAPVLLHASWSLVMVGLYPLV